MEETQELTRKERRALAREEKRKTRERRSRVAKIRKLTIWLISVALIGFAGFWLVKWLNTPSDNLPQDIFELRVEDHYKGSDSPKLTLIEFGDFQCPACAGYAQAVKEVVSEFSGDLRVIYRNFPLVTIHRNALAAAYAAEAAGKQDKFWLMHDLLFDKQSEWSDLKKPEEKFRDYAGQLELDQEKFVEDMKSKAVEEKVDLDIVIANRAKVNSTPSFFLEGKYIRPSANPTAFKNLIREELAKRQSEE